jgi:adhesin transport system membrane fusion protein
MPSTSTPDTSSSSVPPSIKRHTHLFFILCVLIFASALTWAWIGELDIVSMALGQVVPSSKVKTIQHLEGGIIQEILVKEGQEVDVGQPLVELEETASGASVEEIRLRILALRTDIARFTAESREAGEIAFPADLQRSHPELVQQAQEQFVTSRRRHTSQLAEQTEHIRQRQQDITRIEDRLVHNSQSLKLLNEQIAISEELLKDNLTTQYKHLNFLREKAELDGRMQEDRSELKKARSALAGAREKRSVLKQQFREKAGERLHQARQELKEFEQRLKKFSDTLKRTIIRSPVNGIVKTIYLVTTGGIVLPGKPILDIVPKDDSLVVDARLPIRDIGFVQTGQKAVIRLASRDARYFGSIKGKVTRISPDAYAAQDGETFYTARIETAARSFTSNGHEYRLYPGVQVVAYIHTGKRTVLEYFIEPYLNTLDQALQER